MTTPNRTSVLVIDHEETMRTMLQAALAREEYDTVSAASAEDALRKLGVLTFEVVISGLRFDGADGIHLLREIQRRWPDTITIVLTDSPSLESAVAALRAGAHDYLVKPCPPADIRHSVQEGIARRRGLARRLELMQALEKQLIDGLRAIRGAPPPARDATGELPPVPQTGPLKEPREAHVLRAGSFIIDYNQHEALLGDMPLVLTPAEFDILCILVERAPAVLSPQEIARRVFDYDVNEPEARELVRWHIQHLRRKLEIDPDQPHMLKDVRGMGYKLDLT
jgi:two-component system, OmpR family, alkaline phosphatase synthesis response regulator PhoP